MGQSKCCKLFAKFFGQTPNTYLNRYRLGRSLDLLRAGDKSVTEIAMSVGFESASYFAEIFHKHFGMTPREYRKREGGIDEKRETGSSMPNDKLHL